MTVIEAVTGILRETWLMFREAAPYLLFGLVITGIAHALVKRELIARHLGKPGIRSVLTAALIGIPLPLCSCGVIPTAIAIRKNGASKGATLSFLISTPESDIEAIVLTYALIDPLMTVFRPVAGLATAVIAGLSENLFGKREPAPGGGKIEAGCVFCGRDDTHAHPLPERISLGIRYAFTDLLCDLSKWLVIGFAVGGIIAYFVPETFISAYLGYSAWGMAAMLLAGIPMYICATASTPIAAALIAKGLSPGAALVFLLVGPATNMATILAVDRFLGRRSAAIYLLTLAGCAVLAGLALNVFYQPGIPVVRAQMKAAGELIPAGVRTIAAIGLLFFMLRCRFTTHIECRA